MKLRNKRTGEIVERSSIVTLRYKISSSSSSLVEAEEFGSIEQLNAEWEDYKPAEPLIKDDKVRKAVRAWAEAECITKAYLENDYTICRDDAVDASISFYSPVFKGVGDTSDYTIAELCGEEEE